MQAEQKLHNGTPHILQHNEQQQRLPKTVTSSTTTPPKENNGMDCSSPNSPWHCYSDFLSHNDGPSNPQEKFTGHLTPFGSPVSPMDHTKVLRICVQNTQMHFKYLVIAWISTTSSVTYSI